MKTGEIKLSELIPHHGTMCLLDDVESWDDEHVVCSTLSHTLADNPLRRNDHLNIVHAMEYGAQAMAVHGGLLAKKNNEAIKPGYLVALRNAKFHTEHLDNISTNLIVEAHQLLSSGGSLIYEFTVSSNGEILAQARATVMTDKGTE